ncbi:MAG: ethylbenzene dehydrogenase-related protein, partial [Deltaproteobacteria bacterium]|nr:ethylbenzene dehydrogenase-related protein [Deltaproteobacteria bacterium]
MIRKNLISLTVIFALIFGGGLSGCDQLGGEAQLIITATHVHKAPTGLDDPVWQKAPPVLVPVKGRDFLGGTEETVYTRALYTDDSLYFLFKWLDPTRSVTKEAWKF